MAMRRKEPATMLPEQGPEPFAIRLREFKIVQRLARKKLKGSFGMVGREGFQLRFYLEQKHQPVRVALVAMFADDSGQMKIRGLNRLPQFFLGFPAGASVGRLAFSCVQFATRWTPETTVRFLRAFHQQYVVALVEAVEQRSDFIWQRHLPSEAGAQGSRKKPE